MLINHTPWFVLHRPRPGATHRLFCFPYAGGGSLLYRSWAFDLPDWLEVVAVEPPGRQTRFSEAALTSLDTMCAALATAAAGILDKPFGTFGYSLGSIVSVEWTRELTRRGLPTPSHACCAAHRAPHVSPHGSPVHRLADSELIEWLEAMGGTPAALLSEPEWLAHFLTLLRADLALADGYHVDTPFVLPCGLTVFGGLRDPHVDSDTLPEWAYYSGGPFALHQFDGGHFFLQTWEQEIRDRVIAALTDHT
ncbi:thioesterase II family protein [Burkholderia cenocepacia]|uniref:thioesterase II family protein n=1 Tax=Burkholderia cenocepacia TaxID=95486 RepID=UPI0022302E07|nr:thioesterase domain-containing protein [Burkholderia cenocepacia]MCW3610634.1 hypothetical protein [Burkholderia cenocepacia]MCW5191706.1 hypothetical protein [Burkholderia cenocepacia]